MLPPVDERGGRRQAATFQGGERVIMIPKEWREYKMEFRPFVVLGWLLVSPLVVLIPLSLQALPLDWLDAFQWDASTASGWVQAFGSIGAVVAAIWVSNAQGRREQLTRLRREYHYMLRHSTPRPLRIAR